jgi:hypothetical protein
MALRPPHKHSKVESTIASLQDLRTIAVGYGQMGRGRALGSHNDALSLGLEPGVLSQVAHAVDDSRSSSFTWDGGSVGTNNEWKQVVAKLRYRRDGEMVRQRALLAKGLKAVTDPKDRFNVCFAVNAELLPKPTDVHIESTGSDLGAVTPDYP